MVPETKPKLRDYDGEEIIRRLRGCIGYLSGRVAESDVQRQHITTMLSALRICVTAIEDASRTYLAELDTWARHESVHDM